MGCTESTTLSNFGFNKHISSDHNDCPIYSSRLDNDIKFSKYVEIPKATNLQQLYLTALMLYEECNFLGSKHQLQDSAKFQYQFQNYFELITKAKQLGYIFTQIIKNKSEAAQRLHNYVAIFHENQNTSILVDIACAMFGIPSLFINPNANSEFSKGIFNNQKPLIVFISANKLQKLIKSNVYTPQSTYIIHNSTETEITTLMESTTTISDLTIKTFESLFENIAQSDIKREEAFSSVSISPYSLYTITFKNHRGTPQPIFISHKTFLQTISNILLSYNPTMNNLSIKDKYFSKIPYSEIFQRAMVHTMMSRGASIVLTETNDEYIRQHLQYLRPTIFTACGQTFKTLYLNFLEKIGGLEEDRKVISNKAIQNKINLVLDGNKAEIREVDQRLALKVMKDSVGGRLKCCLCQGSLSQKAANFLKIVMDCSVLEVFGLPESSGFISIQSLNNVMTYRGGIILPNIEIRLSELNHQAILNGKEGEFQYPEVQSSIESANSFDLKENLQEFKGVSIRGKCLSQAKNWIEFDYKSDENEEIQDKRWLQSGYVAKIRDDSTLEILGKIKDIILIDQKLPIFPQKIEKIYSDSKLVKEVVIFYRQEQKTLVGVIHLKPNSFKDVIQDYDEESPRDELYKDPKIAEIIREYLNKFAKRAGLKEEELIQDLILVKHSFHYLGLYENGNEVNRVRAFKKFGNISNLNGQNEGSEQGSNEGQ